MLSCKVMKFPPIIRNHTGPLSIFIGMFTKASLYGHRFSDFNCMPSFKRLFLHMKSDSTMSDFYKTIAATASGIYKEKMSKFLSFAHPVSCTEEAKAIVKDYQKRYFDARHVCWAYMIGADRKEFLSNDNGEPSGTAGKPILGQINSFELTNIVIIVVRYFGGIKLGTSGLISAYREAAAEALRSSEIVERYEQADVSFSFPYIAMNEVMKIVKKQNLNIISQAFDNSCQMTVTIRKEKVSELQSILRDIDGVTLD